MGTKTYTSTRSNPTAFLLAALRRNGELDDYTEDELLCVNVKAIWKKPPVE